MFSCRGTRPGTEPLAADRRTCQDIRVMTQQLAIVLAAGKGTRMESEMPKVLVPALERPLIDYVLDALDRAGIDRVLVVVGYRSDDVRAALADRNNVTFVEQSEQLGTGHAVQMCVPHMQDFDGPVLIVTGDSPLTQSSSLKQLLALFQSQRPACILGTLHKDDPHGLGRIVRDEAGDFLAIVEKKDATDQQQALTEVNMSSYVFECQRLLPALRELKNNNRQGEYYITDCPGILKRAGMDVRALAVLQPCEALSVNNLADLAIVEREMRKQDLS